MVPEVAIQNDVHLEWIHGNRLQVGLDGHQTAIFTILSPLVGDSMVSSGPVGRSALAWRHCPALVFPVEVAPRGGCLAGGVTDQLESVLLRGLIGKCTFLGHQPSGELFKLRRAMW